MSLKRTIDTTDEAPEVSVSKRYRGDGVDRSDETNTAASNLGGMEMASNLKSPQYASAQDAEIGDLDGTSGDHEASTGQYKKLEARYQKLQAKYDELDSRNAQLHVERGIWESRYKDLLKRTMSPTRRADLGDHIQEPVGNPMPAEVKAWTEKEPDERKRRFEIGLPGLLEDFEDGISPPIDADAAWLRPTAEIQNVDAILGTYTNGYREHMSKLNSSIQQVTGLFNSHTKAFLEPKPVLVEDPSPALERIYQVFFGAEPGKPWEDEAKTSMRLPVHSIVFLQGLFGAAVHEMVFTKPTPWGTEADWIDKLQPVAPYWNAAMQRKGCHNIKIDDIIWQGLRAQIDSAAFQNRVVMPAAKILANRLELLLHPQLQRMGITGSEKCSLVEFWNRSSANITEMFMDALILEGSFDASPFEYQLNWVSVGREFVFAEMERPSGGPPGEKAVVGKCGTPVLWCRCPAVLTYPWRVHCKAKEVEFRPSEPW